MTSEQRVARVSRKTSETDVSVDLVLDGSGRADVQTGIGFLDHMLGSLTKHAAFDLKLRCRGDLEIDDHHTAEDCALVLGQALDQALGERRGIVRFGHAYAPLDEALARAVVDLSGRPWPAIDLALSRERLGTIACENLVHVLQSLAISARASIHVDVLKGENDHHKVEAAFKALGVGSATGRDEACVRRGSEYEGSPVMTRVAILRTGVANLASVVAAFRRLGVEPALCDEPSQLEQAQAILLPGVGSFGAGMDMLEERELGACLLEHIEEGTPLLAICLGLQLLCGASEEAPGRSGLGVIDAKVERFPSDSVRVPQLGWNMMKPGPERAQCVSFGARVLCKLLLLARSPRRLRGVRGRSRRAVRGGVETRPRVRLSVSSRAEWNARSRAPSFLARGGFVTCSRIGSFPVWTSRTGAS